MKQDFDINLLQGLAYTPVGGKFENHTVVRDEIIGMGRWSTQHELIFLDPEGRHWRSYFTDGATEMQEQDPYEFDACEAERVEPYSHSTVSYRPVEVAA